MICFTKANVLPNIIKINEYKCASYNFQFVVVLHAAYFAYSVHYTSLSIPYVLSVTGEYSSTR